MFSTTFSAEFYRNVKGVKDDLETTDSRIFDVTISFIRDLSCFRVLRIGFR